MDLMLSKIDLLLNHLLAEGHIGVGVGDGEGSQNKFLLELKNKIYNLGFPNSLLKGGILSRSD